MNGLCLNGHIHKALSRIACSIECCRHQCFFPTVNTLEMLNPKLISPLFHLSVVSVINEDSFIAIELVKCNWNTWPPVSISKPMEKELTDPFRIIVPAL